MAEWQPILFGKDASRGQAYGLNAMAESDKLVGTALDHARMPDTSWMVGEIDGRVFFAKSDISAHHLPKGHPCAYDASGRKTTFILGYTAPAGTPLPSEKDLEALNAQISADFKRLAEAARQEGKCLQNVSPVHLPDFSPPHETSSAWNKAVTAIHQGEKDTHLIRSAEGAGELKNFEWLKKEAKDAQNTAETTREQAVREGRSFVERFGQLSGGKKLAVVGGTVALLGAGAYVLNKTLQSKKQEQARQ
jgi:hypothetical protein